VHLFLPLELGSGEVLELLRVLELAAVLAALRTAPLVFTLEQTAFLAGTQLGLAGGNHELLAD
jgi:hypothetical protein